MWGWGVRSQRRSCGSGACRCLETSKGFSRWIVLGEVRWGAGGGSVQCGGEGNGKRGGGGRLWYDKEIEFNSVAAIRLSKVEIKTGDPK